MAKGKFGERLKRERELREVSLDELSKATRISNRFLLALENEDWEKLPGGVFGRGFVRTIARYLGLGEEALLGEYDLARSQKSPPPLRKPEEPIPSPPKWIPIAAVAGLVVLAIVLILGVRYAWHRLVARHAANPPSVVAPSGPQAGAASGRPSASAESSDAPLDLSVSTSSATHVRILGDDNLLLDSDVPAGKTLHFNAKKSFDVSASNSSAVLLQLNGRALEPLGPPGRSGRMVYSHLDLR